MEKKKLIRIIIPVCIVLVVAGIWLSKNSDRNSETQVNPVEKKDSANLVTPLNDEDFKLEATSIPVTVVTAITRKLSKPSLVKRRLKSPGIVTVNLSREL